MTARATTNALLSAALRYAQLGWRVVPLRERAKGPWLPSWPRAASADPATVRAWWAERPESNIGVALGTGSGIVGVDLDGPHAAQVLVELAAGDLPDTLEFSTANGSRLLYAIPPGLVPRNVDIAVEGGELKLMSDGRQTVMPPSIHPGDPARGIKPGFVYAWVEGRRPKDLKTAEMPSWLVAEMCRPEQPEWVDPQTHGPVDAFPPGADLNRRGEWGAALERQGYRAAGGRGEVRYYTRPGKRAGVSVSVGHYRAKDGTAALHCFSSSIPGLVAGKTYDLFGFVAHTEYRGDFGAAAKALGGKGYGTPRPARRHPGANGVHRGGGGSADETLHDAAPAPGDRRPRPEPWEDPIPLDAGAAVPPFPVGVLPADLRDLVAAVAAATNSPPDYVGAAALGIAAGVVGAAWNFDVKDEYPELCSLYVCVVAPKGSGKTPAISYLMAPLVTEQAKRRKAENKVRAFVENVTVEKMADMMQVSPRGLLMVRDELAALFAGFNQYKAGGRGSDRQFYLSCASGSPITVDRKNPDADPVFVAHPRLSVVGGIQPAVMARHTADAEDGLYDRFLYAYPDPLPMAGENGLVVPRSLREEWSKAIHHLWAVEMHRDDEHGDRPYFLRPGPGAWEAWVEWTHWLAAAVNGTEFPEVLRGPAAKIRGYAPRLALVVHALRSAYGPRGVTREVSAEDMAAGVELAKYFLGHARRVWSVVGRDDRTAQARRVLGWATNQGRPAFTRRDAWRHLNRQFDSIEDLATPLKLLVQLGWLQYAPPPEGTVGRPPTATYLVHPTLLTVDTTDKTPSV